MAYALAGALGSGLSADSIAGLCNVLATSDLPAFYPSELQRQAYLLGQSLI